MKRTKERGLREESLSSPPKLIVAVAVAAALATALRSALLGIAESTRSQRRSTVLSLTAPSFHSLTS
ncbi:uncharacterized protein DS421_2g47510 [Arachis hypogaea]|nr:uncharacterized protein DS421_2g47510 [Arachis hypogaea]